MISQTYMAGTLSTKLMAPGHYDPDDILLPMVEDLEPLGVEALHVFTFNQVESTDTWRRQVIAETVGAS